MKKILSLGAAMLCTALTTFAQVSAQINTPMPTTPFGSNSSYQYGLMPTNLPTGGTYGASQDAADTYNAWVTEWVADCGGGMYRVRWSATNETVSEGIAYGMLLAAYAGDKAVFDGLWAYYKNFMNAAGVMDWRISNCSSVLGSGGASDAEVDAAMALLVAEYQWPSLNSPYDYGTEATALINAIKQFEIIPDFKPGPYQMNNGNGWGFDDACRNPGYLGMAYYKCYGDHVTVDQTFWQTNVVNANWTLINSNVHSTTGLCSDWCQRDGTPGGCGDGANYGDDATRFSWRMGVDALWFDDPNSTAICNKIANYTSTGGRQPSTAGGDIPQSGGMGTVSVIYTSMYACAVMGADPSYQSHLNTYYIVTRNMTGPGDQGYFQEILRALGMFVMTGNFWKPGAAGGCTRPDLGADKTLCGAGSVLLDGGIAAHPSRTFTWELVGSGTVGGNTPTYTATLPGTYRLSVDSAGCVMQDEVAVSGVIGVVDLGADDDLCSPATKLLDAGISGAGITYAWTKDASPIGGNTQTLNVTSSGTYEVTLSASGCGNTSDQIVITSSLPTVTDDQICSPGTVNLSVTGTGGPYEWYANATGGSPLTTGTSYSPSISSTTTYYIEDAGTINTTVGPPETGHGFSNPSNSGNVSVSFTASTGFDITQMTVLPFIFFCDGNQNVEVTLQVLDADNGDNVLGTYSSSQTLCTGQQSTAPYNDYYTLTFSPAINIPGPGNYKLAPSAGNQMVWHQDGANYASMNWPGILDITGDSRTDQTNSFPGMFDWQVSTGSNCDRAPVTGYVGCTGTDNPTAIDINVYPNPSETNFHISLPQGQFDVSVVDMQGRTLENVAGVSGSVEIGGDLNPGAYMIIVSGDSGSAKRLILKN